MKKIGILTILALTLSLFLAGNAFAAGMTKAGEEGKQVSSAALFKGVIASEDVVGLDVKNQEGKTIGSVSGQKADANGEIRFLTVSTGGFLGIGEKERLIPSSAFEPTEKADALILTVDEKLVENAPAKTPDMTEEGYNRELYEHYGQAPYWGAEDQAAPQKGY
jgi:hypothetical protein